MGRGRKRGFGTLPKLPNEGSLHNTPACIIIEQHYRNLHLTARWTWDRYARLCQFLQMTPFEVGSLAMISHSTIETFKRENRIEGHGARAQLLLLTLLEAHVSSHLSGDVINNPFPNLQDLQ